MGILGRKKKNKETQSRPSSDETAMEYADITVRPKSTPEQKTKPSSLYRYAMDQYSNTEPPPSTPAHETQDIKHAPLTATALLLDSHNNLNREYVPPPPNSNSPPPPPPRGDLSTPKPVASMKQQQQHQQKHPEHYTKKKLNVNKKPSSAPINYNQTQNKNNQPQQKPPNIQTSNSVGPVELSRSLDTNTPQSSASSNPISPTPSVGAASSVWSVAAHFAPHLTHPHPDPSYNTAYAKKYQYDDQQLLHGDVDERRGGYANLDDKKGGLHREDRNRNNHDNIINAAAGNERNANANANDRTAQNNRHSQQSNNDRPGSAGEQSRNSLLNNAYDLTTSPSTFSYPIYPGSPSVAKRLYRNKQNGNCGAKPEYIPSASYQNTTTPPPKNEPSDPNTIRNIPEPEMPDSTYQEYYGDAYIAEPIRYIYPSGYGSMRPRSFPWRISVFICTTFTWLTIFIVGHCASNGAADWDDNIYYQYYGDGIDDDEVVINTRWCGSRALYFMWVTSVLITAMSCAYCSIIGYIKARDFAVANGRSQPPGMVGKSDYYVRIEDHGVEEGYFGHHHDGGKSGSRSKSRSYSTGYTQGSSSSSQQQMQKMESKKTIYQADGTPRFLGGKIYRPTQAAIHLTSR